MAKSKQQIQAEEMQRAESVDQLLHNYGLDDDNVTLYTIGRSKIANGSSRRYISVIRIVDGNAFNIDHLVANVLGRKTSPTGGIRCHGVGVDMGFHLVHSLALAIWPDGYMTGYRLRHVWL